MLPALAAMKLKPKMGRVCCAQVRRATTKSVCDDTITMWGLEDYPSLVGYRHGTEKHENWSKTKTKVLFLTEGIIMRQVLSHDDRKDPNTILPGCKILMIDEAHSGSTDVELILARILPRIPKVTV